LPQDLRAEQEAQILHRRVLLQLRAHHWERTTGLELFREAKGPWIVESIREEDAIEVVALVLHHPGV
jgi:hypothetical protein